MALELTETRLLEGLGVRKSPGCASMAAAAPAEHRASKEMARSGLGDLEYCGGEENYRALQMKSLGIESIDSRVQAHVHYWVGWSGHLEQRPLFAGMSHGGPAGEICAR